MSRPVIVASVHQWAFQYAQDAGLAHLSPVYATTEQQLRGLGRDQTVIVYDRKSLSMTMETQLSYLAQQGNVVVNVEKPQPLLLDLSKVDTETLLQEALGRLGVGSHPFDSMVSKRAYVAEFRHALEVPEFESAEEALEWLDAHSTEDRQALSRAARLEQAERRAWYGDAEPGPRRGHGLIR